MRRKEGERWWIDCSGNGGTVEKNGMERKGGSITKGSSDINLFRFIS